MSILKIARLGSPVLRKVSRMLEPEEMRSPRIQKLIDDMIETMQEADGVGLAAPQVHESINLLVYQVVGDAEDPDGLSIPLTVLGNVRFTWKSKETTVDWEGCLSVPDMRGKVRRSKSVELEAIDRTGKRVTFKATGFHGRVVQHEADHLEGKVYLDRMDDLSTLSYLAEFHRSRGVRSPE